MISTKTGAISKVEVMNRWSQEGSTKCLSTKERSTFISFISLSIVCIPKKWWLQEPSQEFPFKMKFSATCTIKTSISKYKLKNSLKKNEEKKYFFLILGGTPSLVGVLNLDRADIGESPQDEQQQQRPLSLTPAPHISAYLHILSPMWYHTFILHIISSLAGEGSYKILFCFLDVNIFSELF